MSYNANGSMTLRNRTTEVGEPTLTLPTALTNDEPKVGGPVQGISLALVLYK